MAMWQAISDGQRIGRELKAVPPDQVELGGRVIEMALLDRRATGKVKYQALSLDA